jgi:hypothetical protein
MLERLSRHARRKKADSYEVVEGPARKKTSPHPRKSSTSTAAVPSKALEHAARCRYEIKYRISEAKAQALERFIGPYLHPDRYCKLQKTGAYPIVTLYLDSEHLRLCRQTLEGNKNRFKLRIRSYTDDLDYPRFFEIKRRMNAIIIKSRARVRHQDMETALSGLSLPTQHYSEDKQMLEQFLLYAKTINAGPVMRVRYVRRAYEGDSENRVRVTFDRHLAYNAGRDLDVRFGGRDWQHHASKGVILEIKFTARYPAWLGQMVRCFDLQQQSISKYATSVKQSCLMGFCAPRISVS